MAFTKFTFEMGVVFMIAPIFLYSRITSEKLWIVLRKIEVGS